MENKIELAKLFDLFAADPAYNEDIAAMTVNELCKNALRLLVSLRIPKQRTHLFSVYRMFRRPLLSPGLPSQSVWDEQQRAVKGNPVSSTGARLHSEQ